MTSDHSSGAAQRVLVVDDVAVLRELTGEFLRQAGFAIIEAASGEEALRRAAERPDLIVLDVSLPDLDGFEVCRRLKADAATRYIPILYLSGAHVRPDDRALGLDLGAEGYLTRPVEATELVATVRALLRAGRAEAALGVSERRRQAAEALAEVSRSITQSLDVEEVGRRIVDSLRALLGVRMVGLFSLPPGSETLRGIAVSGDIGGRFPSPVEIPREVGLIGVALREGRAVQATNVLRDDRVRLTSEFRAAIEDAPYRAGVAFPLQGPDRVIGGLVVADREGWSLGDEEFRLTAAFADQAAVALENARLYAEAEARRHEAEARLRETETLLAVGEALSGDWNAEEAMRRVAREVGRALSANTVGAYFVDRGARQLRALAGHGVPTSLLERFRTTAFPIDGSAALREAWETRRPVWSADVMNDDRWFSREVLSGFPPHSVLFAPTPVRGEVVGGLFVVWWRAGRVPSPEELRLLDGIARHVGLALERRQSQEARVRLEVDLHQAQKMDAVGRLASGVAHDFNNLLTVIQGRSELLRGRLGPHDPLYRHADLVHQAAVRAATLVHQLLAFSRRQVLQLRVFDLNEVLSGLEKILRRLISEDVDLAVVPGAALGAVRADPAQIEQVILNLVVNARDAMPQGGRLMIETANIDLDEEFARLHPDTPPGRYVVLSVGDTGVGMDEETQSRLFEPFFTTKGPGKGTGLGLATVYGIVKQSGGEITFESERGRGTTFRIYLPRVEATPEPPGREPTAPTPPRGSETVLLVEDDDGLRELTRELLEMYGYTVIDARHPGEALLVVERRTDRFDLLLTDIVMPQMNGRELAQRIRDLRPNIRVLYMSGYAADPAAYEVGSEEGVSLVRKPFTAGLLAHEVRQALDRPSRR